MARPTRKAMDDRPIYQARTRDVLVRVAPSFLSEQSAPEKGRWFWSYTVEIENHGTSTVQLLSRRWIITDAMNRVEEVVGPGVVGEQPILGPRQAFRYTSGVPLTTSSGVMRGTYHMVADGEAFEVEIPEFSLDLPDVRRTLN